MTTTTIPASTVHIHIQNPPLFTAMILLASLLTLAIHLFTRRLQT
jgi:hypothetical protein